MLWAPGAGQSPPMASVVHPVTWGVQAWAWLSTQAAIAGVSFLSVLHESRNSSGALQGETGLTAFLGEGDLCLLPGQWGQATPLCPLLLQHGASWSLTSNWVFLPLGLGFGALGTWGCASIHSPDAETAELLGYGFILSFHSLSYFLVSKEDQCPVKSRACTTVPMADFVWP